MKQVLSGSAAFGDTDANDTISVSPIICADASDIFMCTWAGISINVDVYTEALKGVVRVIADAYMDGNIRRPGSAAFLGGLQVDTALHRSELKIQHQEWGLAIWLAPNSSHHPPHP